MGNGQVTAPFTTEERNEPNTVISFAFSKFLGDAALQITKGLLSAVPTVGPVIGTSLSIVVSSVSFGSDRNQELLKDFEKILQKELVSDQVSAATGKLENVQTWLKNEYKPSVERGRDRKVLHSMLKDEVNFLRHHVISIVKHEKYEEIGLKTFITAAAVHLAMLQEMAARDPDEDKPEASPHATSITMYASEYAQHAERVANKLVKDRRGQVKFEKKSVNRTARMNAPMFIFFRWKDEATGQEKGRTCGYTSKETPEDKAGNKAIVQQWYEEHKNKVVDKLLSDLGQPLVVASKWRELKEKPIN